MGSRKENPGETLAPAEVPREIEMKLSIAPDTIGSVLAHPLLAKARRSPDHAGVLDATYFDTEERDLCRAGFSLRIRRQGDRRIQTLKVDGGSRGLVLDRGEWETPLDGDALDWRALETTALAPLLCENNFKERLRPVFSVRTDRQAFVLDRKRDRIELVLDRFEIAAGERTGRFGEIELEVKRGTRAGLFAVALDLAQASPVRLSLTTKSERGYTLLDGYASNAVKAERVALRPGQTSAEAFQTVARSCLAQAVSNEALVREHRSAEAVHQFRVGLRRLRAAASLFKDILPDDESRAVREDLQWMNHSTGAVRDLDALISRLREAPDHEQPLAAVERRREESCDQLLATLDEVRFRRGTLAAAAWIETGRWLTLDGPDLHEKRNEAVEERAARELTKRWKRVTKRAGRLAELDPEARHQVRIEVKKLRYGVEFFGGLFTGKKAKKRRKQASAALEQLQEALGALNDVAVGGHLLAPAPEPERLPAEEPDRATEGWLDRAGSIHRDLAAIKPFWK